MSLRQSTLHLTIIALLSLVGSSGQALAANSQQQKMATCNADAKAKNLMGDDRKAFMKSCLSNAPAAGASMNSQQMKMKSCNTQASSKALKGDERKQFMKGCLSAPQAAAP